MLVYYYIFKYCESTEEIGLALFRPFCAWVLILTALMHFALALLNASEYIHAFTRFSGETFGTLIALLFFQAAVKGLKHEFEEPHDASVAYRTVNGVWSVFLALALVLLATFLMGARTWHVGTRPLRNFVADYGATIAVVIITGAPMPSPYDRRVLRHPDARGVRDLRQISHRHVGNRELARDVPGAQIGVAPGRRSSSPSCFSSTTTAPQPRRRTTLLSKPPAYHYDFMLQATRSCWGSSACSPPRRGPQAPMHTR